MGGMVDMAKDEAEVARETTPLMQTDKYPWGLRINLGTDELKKLGVDITDWEIGDVFPLDILAKVISKSANETEGGEACCSVSLQITHIGAEEDESEEDDDDSEPSLSQHGYNRIKYGE